MQTKERDSNLELYRIIVMLLIIAHHYVVNSGLLSVDGPIRLNYFSFDSLYLLLFGAWGKTGINCFVLITGYFMCKLTITFKKFAKLFLEVMFYRFVINFVFYITGYNDFSFRGFINLFIPIKVLETGFVPTYLVFFLFIPFLNILVKHMNEKQHILLLCLLSFTYILFGTLPTFSVRFNYVSWFCVLYIIASYIRLYPKKIYSNTKLWGYLTLFFVILASLSVIALAFVSQKINANKVYYFVQDSNTLLAVLIGIFSFMWFKNLNIKNSKFINTVSSTCFGVLLIHAGGDSMRKWLWKDTLNNVAMYGSKLMIPHSIISVILIFTICCCIDLIRIKFIEKPFFELWDKKYNKFYEKYLSKENKILEKIIVK